MEIGILTFHYAHNYGAVLQAYALKKILEINGNNVEIINYHNSRIEKCYPFNREKSKISKVINLKEFLDLLSHNIEILRGDITWKKQHDNFEQWINDNLRVKEEVFYLNPDLSNIKKDVFICGSDQIWNPFLLNGFDPTYFLNFDTTARKIAYAASMGVDILDKKMDKKFFNYLQKLNFITVREKTLKQFILRNMETRVEVALDPVFLLDKEHYLKFAKKPKFDNYLLIYSLTDNTELKKVAKRIAKRKGYKCIELKYFNNIFQHNIKQIAYAGPNEFLGLIANAECIVTNSFHGTAFSMIFNKEFYCISAGSVNSRISDMLTKFKLIDRLLINSEIPESTINYNNVNSEIAEALKRSKELLFKGIGRNEGNN